MAQDGLFLAENQLRALKRTQKDEPQKACPLWLISQLSTAWEFALLFHCDLQRLPKILG